MFILPPLPYAYTALEPYMDARTVEIHYTKHHQGYVDGLNKTLATAAGKIEGKPLKEVSLETLIEHVQELPEPLQGNIRFFGGGTYNHTFFWESMKSGEASLLEGKLLEAINQTFGSLEQFKKLCIEKATGVRGSGWCWLLVDKQGTLSIKTTNNHDCPLSDGFIPLLVVDVWEHAYYLKYQNRRGEFLEVWWALIDWKNINERYETALKKLKK